MYKIKVRNDETGVIFWEYGFSKYIMKRIHFFFNEVDNDNYLIYNILDITKIVFTFDTFFKCITNKAILVNRER
jgi:hypothetical protein